MNSIEKRRKTNLRKYGVENVAQLSLFQEKKIKTNLRKYGVKYPYQINKNKSINVEQINKTLDIIFNNPKYKWLKK